MIQRHRRSRPFVLAPSAFTGFRFPPDVILLAVRWYLRFGLSYRDLEELLAERGIDVDHVTLFRWVQRFTPELIDAALPARHHPGDRWFVDETYVKVAGVWRYAYRAVDGHGQVIDVFVSRRRDISSARRLFATALAAHGEPAEVITDRAAALANVIEDLIPAAAHKTGQYENNRIECDHGRQCCVDGSPEGGEGDLMKRNRRSRRHVQAPSAFAGFRFPPEVILLAVPVRWYLRYGLSYRDLEELLAERGIEVDHVTLFRWVQRFTPELIDAARPARHHVGDRWFVDETYVKVAGVWRYVYRAVDQHGQVIDVFVSRRRDIGSARRFFTTSLTAHGEPAEVITDRAPALGNVIEDLIPAAVHNTGQYEHNRVECDHGPLKARLRPMRGLKTDRTASVVIRGHSFIQNLRRGHYELGIDAEPALRLATAFNELRPAI